MKTRFLRPAARELEEAIAHYQAQRQHLGAEFLAEVRHTLDRIKRFPLAWHPLGGAIRRCRMRRFPYGIIYEPGEQEIVVIAVAHLRRAPAYWRERWPPA